jgi:hypothetical protein
MFLRRCRKSREHGARAINQRRDKMDIAKMYRIMTRKLTMDSSTPGMRKRVMMRQAANPLNV